ncbi:hypothetical protein DM02DRAFT_555581 [Periconia macrospinosa]|uniref:Ribosomal protein s17 n=1 Tax=Periconia macrospinosa TaxID=97972 RepID=A0A2V1E3R8_9PLEO|nr:hypothetical protein DM02DRAFT_555581 [Periconia macrospinosa]
MFSRSILIALVASAGLIEGTAIDFSISPKMVARQQGGQRNGQQGGQRGGQQGGQTCLNNDLIQSASALTGQEAGTEGIKPGQAPSATDKANFINFCQGQEITNGQQIKTGSCNGIPMGKIPAQTNMITAVITNPKVGVKIPSDTTFTIDVQTKHLSAGFFTNPTTNYYTAPQDLDKNGDIIGHCHVTVQDIGSFQATNPPDPTTFAFFKGIDDNGNGNGLLSATVTDGLPVGIYRVCTMISAQNHQPVNMPVAQRGAQDDCTKFEVVASGKGGNKPSPNNKNGNGAQNQDKEGIVKDKGSKGNGAPGNQQGNNQNGNNQGATNQGATNQNGNNQGATNQNGNNQGATNQNGNQDANKQNGNQNGNQDANKQNGNQNGNQDANKQNGNQNGNQDANKQNATQNANTQDATKQNVNKQNGNRNGTLNANRNSNGKFKFSKRMLETVRLY